MQLRALALFYLLAAALVGAQRVRLDTTSRIISAEIDLMMARPFESILRTQRQVELGYAGWEEEADDSERAVQRATATSASCTSTTTSPACACW
eukprot:COSAG04_NODE_5451_length_1615_cov_4.063984_2_plen_94_part_00